MNSFPPEPVSLHLAAVDTAGNSAKLDLAFTLETTAPPTPVFALSAGDQSGAADQTQSGRVTLVGKTGPGDTVT